MLQRFPVKSTPLKGARKPRGNVCLGGVEDHAHENELCSFRHITPCLRRGPHRAANRPVHLFHRPAALRPGMARVRPEQNAGRRFASDDDQSVILRTKGFLDELADQKKQKGIKIDVVARVPGGGARDRSFKATEDLLQAHPDLKGIFAINDPSALGAVAALEKSGRLNRVKIVGFDGMPEGKRAIKAGQIYADPIQFPDRIGRTAIQTMMKYFKGEDVRGEILIPTQLYRKADADKDSSLN
jgi:hypothetical protein